MYSEILQDSVFRLIKLGKIAKASGCAFTPSPSVWEMYKEDPDLYRKSIVLRPLDISNHPEVIRRLGVIAMNTPLEFDIYGQANSTHVMGCTMMNGIAAAVIICVTVSLRFFQRRLQRNAARFPV